MRVTFASWPCNFSKEPSHCHAGHCGCYKVEKLGTRVVAQQIGRAILGEDYSNYSSLRSTRKEDSYMLILDYYLDLVINLQISITICYCRTTVRRVFSKE